MVDSDRKVTEGIPQLPGQSLELPRPLRPILNHCDLTGLIGERHGSVRYSPERGAPRR